MITLVGALPQQGYCSRAVCLSVCLSVCPCPNSLVSLFVLQTTLTHNKGCEIFSETAPLQSQESFQRCSRPFSPPLIIHALSAMHAPKVLHFSTFIILVMPLPVRENAAVTTSLDVTKQQQTFMNNPHHT